MYQNIIHPINNNIYSIYSNDGKNKLVEDNDIYEYFDKLIKIRDANYHCGKSRDELD